MIHSIYCKINEFHAKFRLLEQILVTENKQVPLNEFEIHKIFGEAHPIVSEHLHCISKALNKLPGWTAAQCIFPRIPFEQSTSEIVANFHSGLFSKSRVLSLTGGLGVDDAAFAKSGSSVLSMDPDACLNAVFRFNAHKLGVKSVERLDSTAEAFLESCSEVFDVIFADPDRRPGGKRTAGITELHSPDIFELYRKYKHIAPRWLVKLSPMTDLTLLKNPDYPPADFMVVEYGEVKEILCDIHPAASGITSLVVITEKAVTKITEVSGQKADFPVFCEPSPGTIKTGLNKSISKLPGLRTENKNNTYFTGSTLLSEGLGRNFRLKKKIRGSLKQIQAELKRDGIVKANISAREFILKTDELRQKLNISDGGDVYLFFTGTSEKKCFICEKI